MIDQILSRGYYIEECRLPGESKADECVPAQHNTIQLSKNRWFVIFETRGFRGVDDNRSVIYQVRGDTPDGTILSEGCLDKAIQDWEPFGDGTRYVKLCNHSIAFGVPEGTLIDGKSVSHAGVFVASWRVNPRILDREKDYLLVDSEAPIPPESYQCYWLQFRLSKSGNDIEIISPVSPMRQKGFESGPAICSHETLRGMNQSFVVPVPYNAACSEWAYMLHWGDGICTPIKFSWDEDNCLYEWVETGPCLEGPGEMGIFEGAIARHRDEWLIVTRISPQGTMGAVWFRTEDPFAAASDGFFSESIGSNCPRTMYSFPDGKIRILTTDQVNSPYQEIYRPRIPLNILEIDPDNSFTVTGSAEVFDSLKEGLPISIEHAPSIHFSRLLPHTGGNTGFLTYFVRPRAIKNQARVSGRFKGIVRPEEIEASGVYYSEITYDQDAPPMWRF